MTTKYWLEIANSLDGKRDDMFILTAKTDRGARRQASLIRKELRIPLNRLYLMYQIKGECVSHRLTIGTDNGGI